MERKKILWLCSWYPSRIEPFNGDFVQRHARAAALLNDIYVIHVYGDTTGVIKNIEKESHIEGGLTQHIVYFKKSTTLWGRFIAHYRWLSLCKQAIRKYMIDNGKPHLVHVHVPMRAGMPAIWFKKRYKIPYVLSEHWGIYNDVEALNYRGRTSTFKHITQKIFQTASVFISVSKYLAEGVNKLVIKKDYQVIHNVVDTDLFFYKEKPITRFRFIHVSNMIPLKNAEGILRAFHLLVKNNANVELIMIGDTQPAIRNYAVSLGFNSGQVQFKGEIPYNHVADEVQQADCFVLFSNIENSPCVIGEALCCGLPVIASAVGGVPELVNDSNSILVPAGNEEKLAEAMLQVMNNYTVYNRKKIAEDAQRKFSYAVIGKRFDEVYNDVIAANPPTKK
jgi:glycosyltransferase involved in cell wall biosynthesis